MPRPLDLLDADYNEMRKEAEKQLNVELLSQESDMRERFITLHLVGNWLGRELKKITTASPVDALSIVVKFGRFIIENRHINYDPWEVAQDDLNKFKELQQERKKNITSFSSLDQFSDYFEQNFDFKNNQLSPKKAEKPKDNLQETLNEMDINFMSSIDELMTKFNKE